MTIIGGGINGCAIANAAAKSGLKVLLLEKADLAGGTSSASSKLIHGGLRYLEHYAFRLVRESLIEREIMWKCAPHIIYPLRFILPHDTSHRPGWLIRSGLFLYDQLGKRRGRWGGGREGGFAKSKKISLLELPYKDILKPHYKVAFEYSDCWGDDSRLVVLNAVEAKESGADIQTRTAVLKAESVNNAWHITAQNNHGLQEYKSKMLVNAAGPWVADIINHALSFNRPNPVQLIKGSHIVVKKLFSHDKAYILQNDDKRIIFALPYEQDFTLIGTTDVKITPQELSSIKISQKEIDYLCHAVNDYFNQSITASDVVHNFSGVRALYDNEDRAASQLSRDYVIELETSHGLPLMHIFGGKITTARGLASEAVAKSMAAMGQNCKPLKIAPLPGGDIWSEDSSGGFDRHLHRLKNDYPYLAEEHAYRLLRAYGSRAWVILGASKKLDDLGIKIGYNLYSSEVDYLMQNEFALWADDVLWRRSKLGLRLSAHEKQNLENYMESKNHG